jgi:alkanesulfonate monooxygenase SsuD/methylene tetrahydromethanopterin reductase-like flavin-dependent oxidoreductase (luciferase family)
MTDTRYFYACAHEQFPPDDLLRQAVSAEEAGFDGIACSDHFQRTSGFLIGSDPSEMADPVRD